MNVECLRKSREYERALVVQILMLAPFAPHFASELWSIFCSTKHLLIDSKEVDLDKDLLEQRWPEIDMDYKLTLHVLVSIFMYFCISNKNINMYKYFYEKCFFFIFAC